MRKQHLGPALLPLKTALSLIAFECGQPGIGLGRYPHESGCLSCLRIYTIHSNWHPTRDLFRVCALPQSSWIFSGERGITLQSGDRCHFISGNLYEKA